MNDGGSPAEPVDADSVYRTPASAQVDARALLADPAASPAEKAGALWTLGRTAYYSNRMADAVVYLREALPLVDDPSRRVDLLLTLAPALSKAGDPEAGLALLDPHQPGFSDSQRGQLHNQRGIVLTELGRLPEAVADLEAGRELLHAAGADAAEARTLVNLGAASSMMGDQDQAEHWYELAWELCGTTGQDVVAAGIEGNLGYVASRRGDFAAALRWYDRARQSFASFEDHTDTRREDDPDGMRVELLIAVLETDYASTLLDVGLDSDAVKAARYAVESSQSGDNRILELQARILLGEAELRLERYREAEANLRAARETARDLGIDPWAMRADYLLTRLVSRRDEAVDADFATDVRRLAEGLLHAGWAREALRASIAGAQALVARTEPSAATELLEWAMTIDELDLADAIDIAFARALHSHIAADAVAQARAIEDGLAEIQRQRRLLGSAELQVRIGHRAGELRDLAVATAIAAGDANAVLVGSESSRGRRSRRTAGNSAETNALLSELRDLRVRRDATKLAGEPVGGIDDRIRSVEGEVIRSHRRDGGRHEPADIDPLATGDLVTLAADDRSVVSYVACGGLLWAVNATAGEVRLVELGPVEPIANAVRAQRAALRRMASDEKASAADPSAQADAVNHELDRLLVTPLDLDQHRPLSIVPARVVSGVAWSGLPSLEEVRLTVAPSVGGWADAPTELTIGSAGLLGGAGLAHADDELDDVASLWGPAIRDVRKRATVAEATKVLASHDLVHIAAHGTFRSDNPYFSSIEFADGPLTLLDLDALASVPKVVVIASCDGAASAGGAGTEVVGTTATLVGLGVSAVVAPTVTVQDLAARRFSFDLHRRLVAGEAVDAAACEARRLAKRRGTPADSSVAQSFQLHGNRLASGALSVSRT